MDKKGTLPHHGKCPGGGKSGKPSERKKRRSTDSEVLRKTLEWWDALPQKAFEKSEKGDGTLDQKKHRMFGKKLGRKEDGDG